MPIQSLLVCPMYKVSSSCNISLCQIKDFSLGEKQTENFVSLCSLFRERAPQDAIKEILSARSLSLLSLSLALMMTLIFHRAE